jgi:hypothetical protein
MKPQVLDIQQIKIRYTLTDATQRALFRAEQIRLIDIFKSMELHSPEQTYN